MSTTRKIAGNTVIQVIGKLATSIVVVGTLSLILRAYGEQLQGTYLLAIAYSQFVASIADFGLGTYLVRAFALQGTERQIAQALPLRLASAVAFYAIGAAAVYAFPYPAEVRQAVWLGLGSSFLISLNSALVAFFQANLRMQVPVLADILNRLVTYALTWTVIAMHGPFLWTVAVLVAAAMANLLANLLAAGRELPFARRPDFAVWQGMVRETAPIWITSLLILLYFRIDSIMLSVLPLPAGKDSLVEIAYYGTAYKFLDILIALPGMFLGVVLPVLVRAADDPPRFNGLVRRSVYALSLLAAPVTVGTYFSAHPLMDLLFPGFGPSAQALQILCFAFFFSALAGSFVSIITSLGEQRRLIVPYALVTLANVILNLLLIPRYSFYGAAAVTVASECLILTGSFLVCLRIRHIGWPFSADTGKTWLAALGMGLLLRFLPANLLVIVPAAVLSYGAFLWILRGYDMVAIRRLITP